MSSPIDERIHTAQSTPTGYIIPSGVRAFREALHGPDAGTAFMGWRGQLFTKALYRAIQDMIVHQPREAHHDNLLVQHGITLGLSLASQMIADPSVLWPDVFGPGMTVSEQGGPDRPPEDFNTSVDDALDNP